VAGYRLRVSYVEVLEADFLLLNLSCCAVTSAGGKSRTSERCQWSLVCCRLVKWVVAYFERRQSWPSSQNYRHFVVQSPTDSTGCTELTPSRSWAADGLVRCCLAAESATADRRYFPCYCICCCFIIYCFSCRCMFPILFQLASKTVVGTIIVLYCVLYTINHCMLWRYGNCLHLVNRIFG